MRAALSLAFCLTLLAAPALAGGSSAPAGGYKIEPLVSDLPGVAPVTDSDLVNPWGLDQLSNGAPVWVSDNGTNKSTFYDRNTGGKQLPVVNIPSGAPTGLVAVPSGTNFNLTENGQTGRAYFLFDSEAGIISGWVPTVDQNNAIVGYDGSVHGSVYKGLALDNTNKHLLTADFTNNQVQILDTSFSVIGSFTDPDLPKRFAPFNVAVLNGNVYVAFAKRERGGSDEIDKPGLGYVDVFTTGGVLVKHLIANGVLNAPWGMAIAPANFGAFSGDLLVGNFGDGKVNVFDPTTGDFLGTLSNKHGKALKIDGLWALDPGPGDSKVTFSAGLNGEADGLLGVIEPN
jgi:uncharacterized protein (TIGR03118 family)